MHKSIKIVPIYFLNVGFIRPENFSTISSVKLFTPAGSIVFPVKYKIVSLVRLILKELMKDIMSEIYVWAGHRE